MSDLAKAAKEIRQLHGGCTCGPCLHIAQKRLARLSREQAREIERLEGEGQDNDQLLIIQAQELVKLQERIEELEAALRMLEQDEKE